jgi:hypothetical protein
MGTIDTNDKWQIREDGNGDDERSSLAIASHRESIDGKSASGPKKRRDQAVRFSLFRRLVSLADARLSRQTV